MSARKHLHFNQNQKGSVVFAVISACMSLLVSHSACMAAEAIGVSPGGRGKVQCLTSPEYQYDLYLPSSYGKGRPLPIVFTSSPGGGGMVNAYKAMGEQLQVIVVGELAYRNGPRNADIIGSVFATLRDVRQRIEFDPTAQFTAGMSGGAWQAYNVARWHPTSISGVIAAGGWLGKEYGPWYRHGRGLLVARGSGEGDWGANGSRRRDANFLSQFDAKIRDWSFPGGHIDIPTGIKIEIMQWLLSERTHPHAASREVAAEKARLWRAANDRGDGGRVFVECIRSLLENPRTWLALEAQKVVDDMMRDYARFQALSLGGLPTEQAAVDYFGFMAYGAGLAGDADTFRSALKCLECCRDRDPEWTRVLGTLLLFAPSADVRDAERGRSLLQDAVQRHTENGSLRMLAAAFAVKAERFDEAEQLLTSVWLPTLSYSGPNGEGMQKHERIAHGELKASLTDRADRLKGTTWLSMLPD
ncbi:MAG: tetratricopeptide repeat protein [Kiritimatiellae bacterium]|jgi:hypothetical protein|nr:tetratricopeptide repeat protein [Kiritimatiellia bacterium]